MRQSGEPRDHGVRVLLDATAMPISRGGVARYVDELVRALNDDVVVVCQPRDLEHYRRLAPDAIIEAGPPALRWRAFRLLWEQFGLPRVARRHDVDAVHSPHYTIPLLLARPRVVTIHDATFFSDPHLHRPFKRVFFRTWIRISTRLADEIVAPSRSTASELERVIGTRAADVLVAHHGVDHTRFRPPTNDELTNVRARYGLDRSYVLFLGTIEPRKNVPALIQAHGLLTADRADPPLLVLAGGQGWEHGTGAAMAEHPRSDLIRHLGYVDADDVAPLLGGAIVVAYPSQGEGFGLPVLEAMATGAVVLTTRHLAIPEVGGDAVAYSTTDPVELAGALARLLDNEGQRHDYAQRARERAASFRWESSAAAHRVAYRSAAAQVPAATGPITLPVLAAEQKVVTQRAAQTAVKQVPAGLDGENGSGH